MIKDSYDYIDLKERTEFLFLSEGTQGKILKGIVFTYLGNNLWNLAFGDIHKSILNDSVISNYFDIVKTMSTIAKVVYEFSEEYPSRHILINPVDEKRKKLYNHVFRRNQNDIETIFYIIGVNNEIDEDYSSEKIYEKFKLKRKFVQ